MSPKGEYRLRLGIANKKSSFLFGTPLDLHYLCRLIVPMVTIANN